jgi:hypothetical protein
VSEIWRAFGLKPWREDAFKVSPDPELVEKIRGIVGLYLNPPVAAVVFAVDEKPRSRPSTGPHRLSRCCRERRRARRTTTNATAPATCSPR